MYVVRSPVIPIKLQHTPISHTPGNPPYSTMKGFPENSLLVKVARSVFQFGVLKQP